MKKIKVLNLYAGIGGNRKLWENVEVTAVEINKSIAKIYRDFFPDDNMVIGDAHQYLLEHYKEYDFIWSSPPCPTHSRIQRASVLSDCIKTGNLHRKAQYPDMRLYQEIILLHSFSNGCKWVVENVKSYYNPLIIPQEVDRHYFWSNFIIPPIECGYSGNIIEKGHSKELQKAKDIDISKYKLEGRRRDATLRSYINPKLGKHILDCAFKRKQIKLVS